MVRFLLILCLSIISLNAHAHQPDISSTLLVEQKDGTRILQIRAALTAFEYEVNAVYGKDSYTTPEKFQDLSIQHLKKNISIYFNEEEPAILENGMVKLGHETNAVFQVKGLPASFNSLTIKNSSFKDISRNQSALIILKEGFAKDQFVLNEKNGHTINVQVKDSKFITLSKDRSPPYTRTMFFIIAGILISGFLLYLWKRQNNTTQ